ncbi:MAG: hypothetical protein KGO81_12200, partial [Bacteroidota bacterium]|nr:hypothetical protein [Bacteroidota bacterium]
MLLIYTKHITSRLQYIAGELWGNNVLLTSNCHEFLNHYGDKIAYSEEPIAEDALHIQPYGLLEATDIEPQNTSCFTWQGLPVFFGTEKGSIPFDLFSAAFYLVTRYEEYLPHNKDEYDRYLFSESIAYRGNFLHLPLIQLWMKALPNKAFHSSTNSFQFLPTYDIDIAYAYTHQPLWKNVLGFYRDLLKVDIDKVSERINIYSGRKKDPFDVFDWLDALHQKFHLQPVYFFLTILQRGLYDKNINSHNRSLQKLYKQLASKYNNGLHPSWQSGEHGFDALLNKEKQQLEKII